ncbi:MAG: SDR family oxidoreductase [Chitinophagaceae bacterium]|nr:SDR family oxidoreductase [Chitinophagaceae bacterium]
MKKLFENNTVIISGGLGDIGKAIALEFAAAGAHVSLGDILPGSDALPLLEEIKKHGVRAHYRQADISDPLAVIDWLSEAEQKAGLPDMIIANAAVVSITGILEARPEQFTKDLSVNLAGAFYMAQAAANRLIAEHRPGRMVFMGSWAAEVVHQHIPLYSVSKAGLRMLAKCFALELAPHNILVNELAPGYVDAGLSGKFFSEDASLKEHSREKVPVKKLITPMDVAKQTLFLCHPENNHITGSVLLMDGGLSLLS